MTTHEGAELELATANGTIKATAVAKKTITEIGAKEIDVRVLKRTPRVLSVAKLVEDGAEFRWGPYGAVLWTGGEWHDLEVQHGVPLLALPSIEQLPVRLGR